MQQIEETSALAKVIWNEHFIPIIGKAQVDYMLDAFLSVKAIEKNREDGYEFFQLLDDELFGFLSLHQEEDRIFLSKLYIEKSHRGKGYAREALSFVEFYCLQLGIKTIWLTCNKNNANTLAAYKKMGFTIFDEAVNEIGNGYVMDDYYMKKELQK